MEQLTGRVALVTGASRGIGAGLVKALVKHGLKVVGCARNIANLQKVKDELKGESGTMFPIQCDVSKPEQVLSMFDVIKTNPKLGGVDICINNAGLGTGGSILTGDYNEWRKTIDVNVLGLCLCSQGAYKSMKERKVDDGHIILINSTLGHGVFPWSDAHFYTATKFAVTAITEGLRQELREAKSGIRVTAVSPGMVETDVASQDPGDEEMARIIRETAPLLQVEDLARVVLFILQSPPHVEVNELIVRPTKSVM